VSGSEWEWVGVTLPKKNGVEPGFFRGDIGMKNDTNRGFHFPRYFYLQPRFFGFTQFFGLTRAWNCLVHTQKNPTKKIQRRILVAGGHQNPALGININPPTNEQYNNKTCREPWAFLINLSHGLYPSQSDDQVLTWNFWCCQTQYWPPATFQHSPNLL